MRLVGCTHIPVENTKVLPLSPDHFPAGWRCGKGYSRARRDYANNEARVKLVLPELKVKQNAMHLSFCTAVQNR